MYTYYKIVVIIIASAVILLGLRFVFSSDSVLTEWGLTSTEATRVLARRLGAIYFGLSVLLFLSITDMSKAQNVTIGVAAISGFLAISGIIDLSAGRVTSTIIRSVVAEVLLSLLLLSTLFIKKING